jgi:hypothetical protein
MTKETVLTNRELAVISLALQVHIAEVEKTTQDMRMNYNPEARQNFKEMLEAAKSALKKIHDLGIHQIPLKPYQPGYEKDYLTNES